MDSFRCWYCSTPFGTFAPVISHAIEHHADNILKVKSAELNITNGKLGYRTHNFGVIPNIEKQKQHDIKVKSSQPGCLSICLVGEKRNDEQLFSSPLSKKCKNMPRSEQENDLPQRDDTLLEDMDCSPIHEAQECDTDRLLLEDIQSKLPDVLDTLREHGQLDIWLKYIAMLSDKTFPMKNIAYLLFLDVVKWYQNDNTSSMRYDDTVVKFWRIGYKLFHGKFIRFMSGPKNRGDLLTGATAKGIYQPKMSKINFAVPCSRITHALEAPELEENLKPGILVNMLNKVADRSSDTKTYKLCLDGKKINSSTSGGLGDIDLFGFEKAPTLNERKDRLRIEKQTVVNALTSIEHVRQRDLFAGLSFPELVSELQNVLTILAHRLKDLREAKVTKQNAVTKFKGLAGDNWKTSNLCNVISALTTMLYDINACIEDTLRVEDRIGRAIATVQHCSHLYALQETVVMSDQENYVHLNSIDVSPVSESQYRFIKQKSAKWFDLRENATVTGSTLNAAVGLDGLKKQLAHFDSVKFKKPKESPTETVKAYMAYGSENEKNANATLVGKILPVFHPNLSLVEEGCYQAVSGDITLIVSPDGSCREQPHASAELAVEIKCPYPKKSVVYKPPVFYSLPRYYVPQVLAEMFALKTESLLFVCYSEQSTTVLRVRFSQPLWDALQTEVQAVFCSAAKRPTRTSPNVPTLKEMISDFLRTNVELLVEVPSCVAKECLGSNSSISDPFCVHESSAFMPKHAVLEDLKENLHRADHQIEIAYKLCRRRASEFLGFMLSDLDRQYSIEGIHSVPIAYGLKGYSLPTDTLREMIEYVLSECSKRGLYVPVCSYDGQWFRLAVRDQGDSPLTLLQLQKDVYRDVKKLKKPDLVHEIAQIGSVTCSGFEELKTLTDVSEPDRGHQRISIGVRQGERRLVVTDRIKNMISKQTGRKIQEADEMDTEIDLQTADAMTSIRTEIVSELSENTLQKILQVTPIQDTHHQDTDDTMLDDLDHFPEALHRAEINCHQHQPVATSSTSAGLLNNDDLTQMIFALQTSQTSKQQWNMTTAEFRLKFSSAENISKSFKRLELIDALRPVIGKLHCHGVKCKLSDTKTALISVFSELLGDGSKITAKVSERRKRKQVSSLKSLARASVSKLPKDVLCAVFAEAVYPERLSDWYQGSAFGKDIRIEGLELDGHISENWYSKPEFNSATQNYLFMVLDSYHQLCGLRRLVCKTGLPSRGVSRLEFVRIASRNNENNCGLSLAMVEDLIDKQNCEYAKTTFSEKVSNALIANGASAEATFCDLVRSWYRAEDDPGISALDRCKARLALREWLLKDVHFGQFPPPGAFVNNVPIALYEGLLTNIERKIQLFTFTKRGCYNVRSVGSLDVENFFGTFQEIDPKGTGVLRPDDIPAALSVATELMDARMDPERGFHMDTTVQKVYPHYPAHLKTPSVDESIDTSGIWRDLTTISPMDHEFDHVSRARGYRKRKKGTISKQDEPARGCQPVRQYHKADESKVLPHVRRGLVLQDGE